MAAVETKAEIAAPRQDSLSRNEIPNVGVSPNRQQLKEPKPVPHPPKALASAFFGSVTGVGQEGVSFDSECLDASHTSKIWEIDDEGRSDDLIATGGTGEAAIELLRLAEAEIVAAAFIIDLPDLGGVARIEALGIKTHALLTYPGH